MQIQLQRVPTVPNLEKFVATVLPQDLVTVLRQASAIEIAGQVRIGNRPSAIIVDGARKSITEAKRRVQALFADSRQLAAALREAWDMLQAGTRRKSGRARASYRLFLNDSPMGGEESIERAAKSATNRDVVRILGPLVPYGRKLYWNPAGGRGAPRVRRVKKKRKGGYIVRSSGERVQVVLTYREPTHRAVARRLARKFRTLTIKEAWPDTPYFRGIGPDASTPGLMFRYKAGRKVR